MDKESTEKYLLYVKLQKRTLKIIRENSFMSEVGGKAGPELNAKQKHDLSLFTRYQKMLRTIKQLDTIVALLGVEPSICLSNQAKIKYSEYLEYNLENYYLRITSILDQAIIFVSDFYNLGSPPQDTSLHILRKNTHTKDKEVVNLLRKFDKTLQPIRKIRNLIAHRGGVKDVDIMKIEANLYELSLFGDKLPDEPFVEKMLKLVDELIDKKITSVKTSIESAKKFLFALDHILSNDEEFFK